MATYTDRQQRQLDVQFSAQMDREDAARRNQFQQWAYDYARAFGFIVSKRGNWVALTRDGETTECMSVLGVQAECEKPRRLPIQSEPTDAEQAAKARAAGWLTPFFNQEIGK